jgi:hypothetical protein
MLLGLNICISIIGHRQFVYKVATVTRSTARVNTVYLLDGELGVTQRFSGTLHLTYVLVEGKILITLLGDLNFSCSPCSHLLWRQTDTWMDTDVSYINYTKYIKWLIAMKILL